MGVDQPGTFPVSDFINRLSTQQSGERSIFDVRRVTNFPIPLVVDSTK